MASLTDDPALTGSVQATRRDFGLLHKAYRRAKMRGDFGKAFEYAQMGESMGLPIGRPARTEEFEGVGRQSYLDNLRMAGQQPQQGGLDGANFQHSPPGNPSIGGYNFNQRQKPFGGQQMQNMGPERDQLLPPPNLDGFAGYSPSQPPLPQGVQNTGVGEPPIAQVGGYSLNRGMEDSAGNAYPSIHNVDRRAAFSRAWNTAKTQEDKDRLVQRAHSLGVPMNSGLRDQALKRLGVEQKPAQAQAKVNKFADLERNIRAAKEMQAAFAMPDSPEQVARRQKVSDLAADAPRYIADMDYRTNQLEEWNRIHPGYDNPEEYARQRIAEVNANTAAIDRMEGRHIADLQDDVTLDLGDNDPSKAMNPLLPPATPSTSADLLRRYRESRKRRAEIERRNAPLQPPSKSFY